VGIVAGDGVTVMHSSLPHLGMMAGVGRDEYPAVVANAVRDAIGPDGTLVVPAPNWDYGRLAQPFDPDTTPVSKPLGVVSAHVAGLAGAVRSTNPIFSVAAIGPQAAFICGGGTGTAFGHDSPWDRMSRLDATVLMLGCDCEYLTFVRYIEHRFGVPYLYNKMFATPVIRDGCQVDQATVAPLRYSHVPYAYDLRGLQEALTACGALRQAPLGGGTVGTVKMSECFEVGIGMLKDDIHTFLAAVPDYQEGQAPVA
jgi:aminoglycoside 3-N-acetyltransferase